MTTKTLRKIGRKQKMCIQPKNIFMLNIFNLHNVYVFDYMNETY